MVAARQATTPVCRSKGTGPGVDTVSVRTTAIDAVTTAEMFDIIITPSDSFPAQGLFLPDMGAEIDAIPRLVFHRIFTDLRGLFLPLPTTRQLLSRHFERLRPTSPAVKERTRIRMDVNTRRGLQKSSYGSLSSSQSDVLRSSATHFTSCRRLSPLRPGFLT